MNMRRLPLRNLAEIRSNDLGLSRSELVRRCGFQNVNKGIRRIERLFGGDLGSPSASMILPALPSALEIDKEIIESPVRESAEVLEKEKRRIADEQNAKWRASFQPEAFLLGERIPRQIVLFAVTGGPTRWLKIPLDLSRPPITYVAQALSAVRKTPIVPFFGATTGFVINYRADFAVRFDPVGNPVEAMQEAYVPGHVQIEIGNRKIDANDLVALRLGSLPPR